MYGYKHTQIGTLLITIHGGVVLILLGLLILQGYQPIIFIVFVVLIISGSMFATLTIEIKDNFLRWRFGPGLIRKKVKLGDIESVEIVKNHWLYGWGIRITPHGWLYNVSGLDAVQVRLKSGKRFRLGTDEADELLKAVQIATQGPSAT